MPGICACACAYLTSVNQVLWISFVDHYGDEKNTKQQVYTLFARRNTPGWPCTWSPSSKKYNVKSKTFGFCREQESRKEIDAIAQQNRQDDNTRMLIFSSCLPSRFRVGCLRSPLILGNLSNWDGNVNEDGCGISNFPFSCLYNSRVSFSFCLKVCQYENLEALFLELHEGWNDLYSNVHVLYKTWDLRFSRSVSKDDGGKVTWWLHFHVQWLYSVT